MSDTEKVTPVNSDAILGMAGSYNMHSEQQLAAINRSFPYIRLAVEALDAPPSPFVPLIVADFGVAHGANSMAAMRRIVQELREVKRDAREPLIVYNDLTSNDWKPVLGLLADETSHNGVISGRSFYQKCLPRNSLSIAYSSLALQWLSKSPCNLSDHCDVEFTRNAVEREAFAAQAYHDYCDFIKNRSIELLPGGVLTLVIIAVNDQGESGYEGSAQLLYKCAQMLPLTAAELLDYTMPSYCRSYAECIDQKLFAECSLDLIHSDFVTVASPLYQQWRSGQLTLSEFAHENTASVRSWSQSILEQVLHKNGRPKEEIPRLLGQFYELYEKETQRDADAHVNQGYFVYVVLRKKPVASITD